MQHDIKASPLGQVCKLQRPLTSEVGKKQLQRRRRNRRRDKQDMGLRPHGKGTTAVERFFPKQTQKMETERTLNSGVELSASGGVSMLSQCPQEDKIIAGKGTCTSQNIDYDTKLVIDEDKEAEPVIDTSDTQSNCSSATSDTSRFRGPKKKFLEEFRRSDSSPALETSGSEVSNKVATSSQNKGGNQEHRPVPDSNVNDDEKVCDSTKSDDVQQGSAKYGEKVPMFNLRSCIDLIIDSPLIQNRLVDTSEILNGEYNIKVSLSRLEQGKTVRDLVKTSSNCDTLRNVLDGSADNDWKNMPVSIQSHQSLGSTVSTSSSGPVDIRPKVETISKVSIANTNSSAALKTQDIPSNKTGITAATDDAHSAVQSPLHQIAALASMLPRQPITAMATEADKLGNSRDSSGRSERPRHPPLLPAPASGVDSSSVERTPTQVASKRPPPPLIDILSPPGNQQPNYVIPGGPFRTRSWSDSDFRPQTKLSGSEASLPKRPVLLGSHQVPHGPRQTYAYQPSSPATSTPLVIAPSALSTSQNSFSPQFAGQISPASVAGSSVSPKWTQHQQLGDQRMPTIHTVPSIALYGEHHQMPAPVLNQQGLVHVRHQVRHPTPGKSPSPRGSTQPSKGQRSCSPSPGPNSVRYVTPSTKELRSLQEYQGYSPHGGPGYLATTGLQFSDSSFEAGRPPYPISSGQSSPGASQTSPVHYTQRSVPQKQSVRSYHHTSEQQAQQAQHLSSMLPSPRSLPPGKPLGIAAALASHPGTVGVVAPSAAAAAAAAVLQSVGGQAGDAPLDLTTKAKPFTQLEPNSRYDKGSLGEDTPLDLTVRRPTHDLIEPRSHFGPQERPGPQTENSGFSAHIKSLENSMQKRMQTIEHVQHCQIQTNRQPPPLGGLGHHSVGTQRLPYVPSQSTLPPRLTQHPPRHTPPTSHSQSPSTRPPISQETQSAVKHMLSYPPVEKTLSVTHSRTSTTTAPFTNTENKRGISRGQIRMNATTQLLGNHPPDDILYLKCNVCNSTYGSLHSFRKHFYKVHGFGPTNEHVTVRSISATRGSASKTEKALDEIEKPVHAEQIQGRFLSPPSSDVLTSSRSPAASPDEFHGDQPYDMVHMQVQRPCTMGELEHKMAPLSDHVSPQSSVGDKSNSPSHKPTDVSQSMMRCLQCGQDFPTRDWGVFRRHVRAHEQPQLKCSLCRQTFTSARDLQEHNKTYHQDQMWVCRFCGVGFTHPGALGKHMKMVHESELPQDEEYKCQLCPLVFLDMQQLLIHLGDHKDQADAAGRCADALVRGSVVRRASPDSTNDVEQKPTIEDHSLVTEDKKLPLEILKEEVGKKPKPEFPPQLKQDIDDLTSSQLTTSEIDEENVSKQAETLEKVSRLPPNKTLFELITDKVEEETRKYLNAPQQPVGPAVPSEPQDPGIVHPSSTTQALNGSHVSESSKLIKGPNQMGGGGTPTLAPTNPNQDFNPQSAIVNTSSPLSEIKTEAEAKGKTCTLLQPPFKTMRDALNMLVERAVVDAQDGRKIVEVTAAEFILTKDVSCTDQKKSLEGTKDGAAKEMTVEDQSKQRLSTKRTEPVNSLSDRSVNQATVFDKPEPTGDDLIEQATSRSCEPVLLQAEPPQECQDIEETKVESPVKEDPQKTARMDVPVQQDAPGSGGYSSPPGLSTAPVKTPPVWEASIVEPASPGQHQVPKEHKGTTSETPETVAGPGSPATLCGGLGQGSPVDSLRGSSHSSDTSSLPVEAVSKGVERAEKPKRSSEGILELQQDAKRPKLTDPERN